MAWFDPPDLAPFARGTFPSWAIDPVPRGEDHGLFYGFPVEDERRGFKAALHRPGESCDPDEVDRDPRPGEADALRELLRRWLPSADGPVVKQCVCLYTNTPDGHFVIDRHPAEERVVVAAGFSGHGFKFASVVGEALADLATEGRTDLPIGFLGLGRFRG
jgi:sarcosine oxidase